VLRGLVFVAEGLPARVSRCTHLSSDAYSDFVSPGPYDVGQKAPPVRSRMAADLRTPQDFGHMSGYPS